MRILALLSLMTMATFPLGAAAFCPVITPTSIPGCAVLWGPSGCPTQAECDRGWQWASPSAPMKTVPTSLTRFANGHLAVNQCTLDPAGVWSNPRDGQAQPYCGDGNPPTISFAVWCEKVKALPLPPECATLPCVRPDFTGGCGLPLFGAVPFFVEETLAAAPGWVSNSRQEARLRRVAAWVKSVSGK